MAGQVGENTAPRSLTEWMVLALLAEKASHGFALARALSAGQDLGRILTVRRPLVYRALDRLADAQLVEAVLTEPGRAGPNRTLYQPTPAGRRLLDVWLATPVDHVRDLRVEFLAKLRLLERNGVDRSALVAAQRHALDQTLAGLAANEGGGDVVDRWRASNATAAREFLDGLARASLG
jgi:PadR family transcriptional regulator AphA